MIRTTLRKKYHGLSREELLDLVYEMGVNYMKHSGSCSQSTVAAIHELVEMDDVAVRVASSSAGGQLGQAMGTCGALIGSTIVLDYFFGRPANTSGERFARAAYNAAVHPAGPEPMMITFSV